MNHVGPSGRLDLRSLLHAAHAAQAEVESKLEDLGLLLPKLAELQALSSAG